MHVLFDIGGSKTRVATTNSPEGFLKQTKFDTPRTYSEGLAAIADAVEELAEGEKVERVIGGIRGVIDPDRGGILYDTILSDWVGKPIVETLTRVLEAEVLLLNDAVLAGVGEANYGAGRGYRIVAYHTVSTGVGGARVVDGLPDIALASFEPGKQYIDIDQSICPECDDGTLEGYISGSAIEKQFKQKPYDIPQDDPLWPDLAQVLAHGLRNTVAYWSPEVIVLGGSMILGNPRIMLKDIQEATNGVLGDILPIPDIKDAELGDDSGLYGALALVHQI